MHPWRTLSHLQIQSGTHACDADEKGYRRRSESFELA
jgi:hypothetical protein